MGHYEQRGKFHVKTLYTKFRQLKIFFIICNGVMRDYANSTLQFYLNLEEMNPVSNHTFACIPIRGWVFTGTPNKSFFKFPTSS